MKKYFLLAMVVLTGIVSSCKYDDDELWDSVNNLADRVTALETITKQMNSDISAMQSIISALEKQVSISDVEELTDGYIIHFSDGTKAIIKNGTDGKDGINGADGKDGVDGADGKDGLDAPIIDVDKENGIYYWTITVDGVTTWLTDDAGNKLPVSGTNGKDGADGEDGKDGADGEDGKDGVDGTPGTPGAPGADGADGKDGKDGITPKLKIDADGYWMVSYDNGTTYDYVLNADGKKVNAVGPKGDKGDTGATGSSGSSGSSGSTGATGAQGPAGPRGPKGEAGDSKFDATEPVKDNGNGTITIKLADGTTTYVFPKAVSVIFKANGAAFDAKDIELNPTSPFTFTYEFPSEFSNVQVEVLKEESVVVTVDESNKTITVKQKDGESGGKVILLFYNANQTITSVFTFKATVSVNGIAEANLKLKDNASQENLDVNIASVSGTNNVIELPDAGANAVRTFVFDQIASGSAIKIIEENDQDTDNYHGKVVIEIPEGVTLSSIDANVPNGEVWIKQGTVETLITLADDNTTIIGTGATVTKITVKKGNVRLEAGAVFTKIERQTADDDTSIIYVIYEGEKPEASKIGEGLTLISAAEYDLMQAFKNGGNYTLTEDVVLTNGLTLASNTSLVLDLNGKTISQTKEQVAAYSMITNQGELTIVNNATTEGYLKYGDTKELSSYVNYVSNTIQNSGKLTIEEGITVENNSVAAVANNGYPHPIDNSGELIINGGTVTNNANYSSVRIWCTTDDNTKVTINSGTFNGCIDLHNVNTNSNKGTLTIKNGTFNADTFTKSAVRLLGFGTDVDELTAKIEGGTFNGKIALNKYVSGEFNSKVFSISGGTFKDASVFNFLANDASIVLGDDMELNSPITIAQGIALTLDLNGQTMSYTDKSSATSALIFNNGNLTINDNSTAGNGALSFTATNPSVDNTYANNTITNKGKIEINAGNIINNTIGGACYALDNYAGSEASVSGGKLIAEKTTVRIFQWTDGENNKATLNIANGEIISKDGYAVNLNMGNTPYVEVNISGGTIITNDTYYNLAFYSVHKASAAHLKINVTGGTFKGAFALNRKTCETMVEENISISNGTFGKVICYGTPLYKFIKGGTFAEDYSLSYVKAGYTMYQSSENEWKVFNPEAGGISNAAQLFAFAKMVNESNNNFSGKTIKLTADIDLENKAWTPIGQTGFTQFNGTFDGDGKTIFNLSINSTDKDDDGNYASGLFGWTEIGTIKNVNINGAKVEGGHLCAAVIGYISGSVEVSGCTVSNAEIICKELDNEDSDPEGDKAACVVGQVGGTSAKVSKCHAETSKVSAGRDAGQVVGAALGDIANGVTECTASNVTVEANGTSTGKNINNNIIGRS